MFFFSFFFSFPPERTDGAGLGRERKGKAKVIMYRTPGIQKGTGQLTY